MKKKLLVVIILLFIIVQISYSKNAKGDGIVNEEIIFHSTENNFYNNINEVNIELIAGKNDFEYAEVIYTENRKKRKNPLKYIGDIGEKSRYVGNVQIYNGKAEYYFMIKDGRKKFYFGKTGIKKEKDIVKFSYDKPALKDYVSTEWVKSGIAYEIVIDRFRNGNKNNDPVYNEISGYLINPVTKRIGAGLNYQDAGIDIKPKSGLDEFSVSEWGSNWRKSEKWEAKLNNISQETRRYGGDIAGIVEKIDYFKELGVNTLILSAPFYGSDALKTAVNDFMHVDPSFGVIINENIGKSEYKMIDYDINTMINMAGEKIKGESKFYFTESDKIFSDMIKKLHQNGIRVIIKMPSDYTSVNFPAFRKAIKDGPNSEYANWYNFEDWKNITRNEEDSSVWNPVIEYSGNEKSGVVIKDEGKYRKRWIAESSEMSEKEREEVFRWNIKNTRYLVLGNSYNYPKLNFKNKNVYEYYENSLLKWVKGYDGKINDKIEEDDGIDGVIFCNYESAENKNELNNLSDNIKSIKKEFYFGSDIGLISKKELHSSVMNGVLNYGVILNGMKLLINRSKETLKGEEFALEIEKLYFNLSDGIARESFNSTGGPDSDRVYSMVINPNRDYDRENDGKSEKYRSIRPEFYSENAIRDLKNMVILQFSLPGIPLVYYGDEKGMWGADTPENIKPMLWEDINYAMESDFISKYKSESSVMKSTKIEIDEANGRIFYKVEANEDIVKFYKKIIKARTENQELFTNGEIKFIVKEQDKNCLAYEISDNKRSALVLFNLSDKENSIKINIENNGDFYNVDDGERYSAIDKVMEVKLKAKEGILLIKK